MYERHYLSACLPDLTAEEYKDLKASIKKIGVQVPVILYDNQVLDGWHRYRAVTELDLECPAFDLDKDVDPVDFVRSSMARRSMTSSQKALAVVKISDWKSVGDNQHLRVAHDEPPSKSTTQMAKEAGVAIEQIKRAKKVAENAVEEVQEAVKSGKIGVFKASEIANLPAEEQAAAIDKPIKKSPEVDYSAPSDDEIAANEMQARADLESMNRLLDADDVLKEAYAEIKRLNAENVSIRQARDRYMNQCNEAIRMVKSLQKKLDKLTKA